MSVAEKMIRGAVNVGQMTCGIIASGCAEKVTGAPKVVMHALNRISNGSLSALS